MRLLLAGTRHLWFVVGLLGESERLFNRGVLGDVERSQRMNLFDSVARWLPEIVTLAPFFAAGSINPSSLRCPFGLTGFARWPSGVVGG